MATRTAKRSEITGAAARYQERKLVTTANGSPSAGWQEQAWSFYSDGDTPEVGFASTWIGNAMRKATLFAGRRNAKGEIEPLEDSHPAVELVAQIAGGPAGQAELLAEFGPHLVVAGEGWILIRDEGKDWRVLSVLELANRGGRLEATVDDEKVIVPGREDAKDDPEAPLAIRVWDPHPRKHIEADSPVRRSLGLLNELRLLNASVAAIARSQLTGRGVIFVPQGTRFPTAPGTNSAEDDLIEVFMQVAETAYRDPESAAAAVPIILEVPTDGKWDRLTFESAFDELAITLREEAIRRFAAGLDTPAEVLLGMADVNHWGQWFLQEEAISLAVEPRLGLVSDALTTQWLRPLLDVPDVEELVVWFDSSQLRVRSNRPQTALEVQRAGGIGLDALRRETGFDDADAPSPEEQRRNLLFQLVAAAPSLAPQILPLLGINLNTAPATVNAPATPNAPAPESDSQRELPVDESPRPPDQPEAPDPASDPGLQAATHAAVERALELAGKRLRSRQQRSNRGRLEKIDPVMMHVEIQVDSDGIERFKLLDKAWDRTGEIARRYHINADCYRAVLDQYTRDLMVQGVPHEWDITAAVLRAPCLTDA